MHQSIVSKLSLNQVAAAESLSHLPGRDSKLAQVTTLSFYYSALLVLYPETPLIPTGAVDVALHAHLEVGKPFWFGIALENIQHRSLSKRKGHFGLTFLKTLVLLFKHFGIQAAAELLRDPGACDVLYQPSLAPGMQYRES